MEKIFIGLGSNLGDREKNLKSAINLLSQSMKIEAVSSIYETEPWGEPNQPNFYNAVVNANCGISPFELLKNLKDMEKKLGRKKDRRRGTRIIDLDILLFGNEIITTDQLTIPHKQLLLRDFFLEPMLEINSDLLNPTDNLPLSEYLERMPEQLRTVISKIESKDWEQAINKILSKK